MSQRLGIVLDYSCSESILAAWSPSPSRAQKLNNTIYIGPCISQTVVNENTTNKHRIAFRNNLVVKEGAGAADFSLRSGAVTASNNTLHNVNGAPANPGGSTADPLLMRRGTVTGLTDAGAAYALHADSLPRSAPVSPSRTPGPATTPVTRSCRASPPASARTTAPASLGPCLHRSSDRRLPRCWPTAAPYDVRAVGLDHQ